jgi:putative flippase GtrA
VLEPTLGERRAPTAMRGRDMQKGRNTSSRYAFSIVQRLRHYLFVRHGHNWRLLFRFGLVGGSGVFVNMLAVIICHKTGPNENGVFFDLPLTDFNVRWYHVYSTIAFLAANLWNFQLNRRFTFRSAAHSGWFREYFPFLAVGMLGQAVGLGILTLLMHPHSIFSLSTTFFDDSTGFSTWLYWAQLITIAIVTPLSFVLNKIWTFSAVRRLDQEGPAVEAPTPGERARLE